MRRHIWLAVVVLAASLPVRAQEAGLESGRGERPWAVGVPAERQQAALALFREGNIALKEALYVKAAQRYREALGLWDHPAIHYNLALALVNLDQPIETHEHLVAALKYGVQPLDPDKFAQAQRYQSLIEKQLARIEVRCDSAAAVKLDGQLLFTAPGIWEGLVRAGAHTLAVSKEGFLPLEQSPVFAPGDIRKFELRLLRAEDLTEYRQLWPSWIPWSVAGAGALVVGTSAALHVAARNAYASYDNGIKGCVQADTGGCRPSAELAAQRARGDTLQGVAVTGYVIGGAALAAGATLLYLNRPRPYTVALEVKPGVTLLPAPLLGPGVAGASLGGTF